jgi:hypothetical protein
MNWQTQLKHAVRATERTADKATAVVTGRHPMVEQLLAAAALFAPRTDSFAMGKAATCRDIAAKLIKYGSFASPAQAGFAEKLVAWSKPREQAAASPVATVPVPKLFTVMQKHAHFYAGDLKLSRKNGDTLVWIMFQGVCVGKIENAQLTFFGKRLGANWNTVADLLAEFEANPLVAAVKYGKLSGTCCSCGRDLTNDGSIEAGIGPICASKFQ